MYLRALLFISFVNVVVGIDFSIGMYRKEDILVSQDIIYKERFPFRETTFKYGKTFDCLISYFRIADRLGAGNSPKVRIIRGGLRKKYIVAKIWSYNQPIAVTVQVGCKSPMTTPSSSTTHFINRTTPSVKTNTEGETKAESEKDDSGEVDKKKEGDKKADKSDKEVKSEAEKEDDDKDDDKNENNDDDNDGEKGDEKDGDKDKDDDKNTDKKDDKEGDKGVTEAAAGGEEGDSDGQPNENESLRRKNVNKV